MKIAHISDLHLPGNYYVSDWGEQVIKTLNSTRLDLILITGDITDNGYQDEYEIAKEFVEKLIPKKMIILGNHDSRNSGYVIFEQIFGNRFPYYELKDIGILGLDSSEPDIDEGHIGRENYILLKDKLSHKRVKIVALHHHVIPIPNTGRERNILIDSGDFLKLCIDLNINLVLSGHKHMPWIWKLENTYFITAGTACSRRLKGKSYPSFYIYEISDELITINEINSIDGKIKNVIKITNI